MDLWVDGHLSEPATNVLLAVLIVATLIFVAVMHRKNQRDTIHAHSDGTVHAHYAGWGRHDYHPTTEGERS